MWKPIEVQNLSVGYRAKGGVKRQAVTDLSFFVQTGEIVGFLGPNGAGKSSTLKALMGFVEPEAGSCFLVGMNPSNPEARKRVGYLPEVATYYPYLTPLETLRLYGELQGLKGRSLRVQSEELLASVGLSQAMTKLNKTLSKGMLQRVGIAQALLGEPEILILDEVTSGLDPIGRRELRLILKQRQSAGCSILLSSHELDEVDALCNRLLFIQNGSLMEERGMTELKDELKQLRIVFDGEISPAAFGKPRELPNGHRELSFHTKEDMLRAIQAIIRTKGKLIDVVSEEGSLEDYFVETLRRAA